MYRKINSSTSLRSVAKSSKNASVISLSSASNAASASSTSSSSSSSSSSSPVQNFFYFLPVLIVAGAYIYSVFSTMSFPFETKVMSIKPAVISGSPIELSVYWTQFCDFVKRILLSFASWLLRVPAKFDQFIGSLDFQKYQLLLNQFQTTMPITAGILTTTLSILALLLMVFSIYIFCKLFLFISETSDALPNQNDALSTTSVHVQRRQSITAEHKWPFDSNSMI